MWPHGVVGKAKDVIPLRRDAPSWFGEPIGRYEGDTLVVDTIGMNDNTYVDNFRTPHSDKLRTIERFRISPDGKAMDVNLHGEAPGAFTIPWDNVHHTTRADQERLEMVCAENHLNVGDIDSIRLADRPDV